MSACHSVCAVAGQEVAHTDQWEVRVPCCVQFSIFWTTGQICTATSRLLVAVPIATQFFDRLKASCLVSPSAIVHARPSASRSRGITCCASRPADTGSTNRDWRPIQRDIQDGTSHQQAAVRQGPRLHRGTVLSCSIFLGAERYTAHAPVTKDACSKQDWVFIASFLVPICETGTLHVCCRRARRRGALC